jgi:hypothetical protein
MIKNSYSQFSTLWKIISNIFHSMEKVIHAMENIFHTIKNKRQNNVSHPMRRKRRKGGP